MSKRAVNKTAKAPKTYYTQRAESTGLSVSEMMKVNSLIKNKKMTLAEAREILKSEPSKFIRWRIKHSVKKAERQ